MISKFEFFLRKQLKLCGSLSDREFLSCQFRHRMGRPVDWDNPTTFNEKLQWLKVFDRKDIYTTMVDKYAVKEYAAGLIGKEYIIPSLGIWDSFDEIDFAALPSEFVLKCTHDSGGLVICRNKSELDTAKAKAKLSKRLSKNYYYFSREWPYKNVRPGIMAETFIRSDNGHNLNVYKIFNFMGEPKLIQVVQDDKTKDETIDYFDTDWQLLELRQNFPNSPQHLPRPETLDEMLQLASRLSQGFPFLRTDFYEVGGRVLFSEFTFYSDAGFRKFIPEKWDRILGDWIVLPGKDTYGTK